jgi:hypothetical protein
LCVGGGGILNKREETKTEKGKCNKSCFYNVLKFCFVGWQATTKKQMLKFANYFLKGRSLAIYKMLCDLKTLIGTKWQISRIVKSGFYETC